MSKIRINSLNNPDGENIFIKNNEKHTRFSKETLVFNSKQQIQYNFNLDFDILQQGDLIHKMYFEIQIPKLSFTKDSITDLNYKTIIENNLRNIKEDIDYWNNLYVNLKNFCEIELLIYKEVIRLLEFENLTTEFLKKKINTLENKYKENRNNYKLLVEEDLLPNINIVNYINNLSTTSELDISTTKNDVNEKKENLNNYLNYYLSNLNYNNKKYDEVNNNFIDFSWIDNLSSNFFTFFEVEIGGITIDKYSNDMLHIYTQSDLDGSEVENYYKLSGKNLSYFDNNEKPETTIYVPLIFWFNKEVSQALPLIALKNTEIKIKTKVNDIKNLLYFQDWEKEYNKLLIIDIPKKDHSLNSNNTTIKKTGLTIKKSELLLPEYIYRYHCENINKTLLDLQFPGIDSESILDNYGSIVNNESVLTLENWINLRNKLKSDTFLSNNTKYLLGGYHYFIDYNYLYNSISPPDISLLVDYMFIDDYERYNFVSNELEYMIESYDEISLEAKDFEINDFDLELNGLVKELFWFMRPKLHSNGLSKYGKKDYNTYSEYTNFSNYPVDKFNIFLNKLNLLDYNNNEDFNKYYDSFKNLNGILPNGIYYKTFSLYPNDYNPSGTINLTEIKGKYIELIMNQNFRTNYFSSQINPDKLPVELKILYKKYNLLTIKNGTCKLVFN